MIIGPQHGIKSQQNRLKKWFGFTFKKNNFKYPQTFKPNENYYQLLLNFLNEYDNRTDENAFTFVSWNNYQEQIEEGREQLSQSPNIIQNIIDQIEHISNQRNSLKKRYSPIELLLLYLEYNDLLTNSEIYDEDSWQYYEDEVLFYVVLIDDNDQTEQQIEDAIEQIIEQRSLLSYKQLDINGWKWDDDTLVTWDDGTFVLLDD